MYGKRGGFGKFITIWSVIFILIILFVGIVTGTQILKMSAGIQQSLTNQLEILQDGIIDEKYNQLASNIITKENLVNQFQESLIVFIDGSQIVYNTNLDTNIDKVYSNCNAVSFSCDVHERNHQITLANQFNLNTIKKLIKAKEGSNNVLILLPKLNEPDLVNVPFSSIIPEESTIFQEINQEFKELYTESLKREIPEITDKSEMIKLFLDGYYYELTKESILFKTEFGLQQARLKEFAEIAIKEYKSTDKTIQERLIKYKETIERYYPTAQEVFNKKKVRTQSVGREDFIPDYDLLDSFLMRISNIVSSKTLLVKSINELGQSLTKTRQAHMERYLVEPYQKRDIQESDVSKLLRLKILQVQIVKTLLSACEEERDSGCILRTLGCRIGGDVDTCMVNFLEDTGSPDLCDYAPKFTSYGTAWMRDECYLRFSKQNPILCSRIIDSNIQQQCENEFRRDR